MKCSVTLARKVIKALPEMPPHIVTKLKAWVDLVEVNGLQVARRIPGYHDEPLIASRAGQRSIRLSISYRAFYTVIQTNEATAVIVLEINKHDY